MGTDVPIEAKFHLMWLKQINSGLDDDCAMDTDEMTCAIGNEEHCAEMALSAESVSYLLTNLSISLTR